jgi:hypothetical protein
MPGYRPHNDWQRRYFFSPHCPRSISCSTPQCVGSKDREQQSFSYGCLGTPEHKLLNRLSIIAGPIVRPSVSWQRSYCFGTRLVENLDSQVISLRFSWPSI